jgi:sarcosine oxidase subunit beta
VTGTVVAAAGGHGMMYGPGVSQVAADLALTGTTDLVDLSDLGLDRFDEHGRSRLTPDPIALPFPESVS